MKTDREKNEQPWQSFTLGIWRERERERERERVEEEEWAAMKGIIIVHVKWVSERERRMSSHDRQCHWACKEREREEWATTTVIAFGRVKRERERVRKRGRGRVSGNILRRSLKRAQISIYWSLWKPLPNSLNPSLINVSPIHLKVPGADIVEP